MHNFVVFTAQYLVVLPPLVWLAVLWRLPKPKRWQFMVFSLVSTVLTLLLVKIATSLHQDPRPFIRDHVHPYFRSSTDNGFPSDHTAFSALIALIVMRYNRRVGTVLLAVAIAIGTARVISGVHHGQDIFAGVLIAGIGVGLAWGGEKALRRFRTAAEG